MKTTHQLNGISNLKKSCIIILDCEVVELSTSRNTDETYSKAMGTYLKLLDPINGKVAYQKETNNSVFFMVWSNRSGWMVRTSSITMIQSINLKLNSGLSLLLQKKL